LEETAVTKALEDAFREASKLPESEQDSLAAAIRSEIATDADWDRAFRDSQDVISRLADEALDELRSGKTQSIDPEKR
jgi:hypothetical protein